MSKLWEIYLQAGPSSSCEWHSQRKAVSASPKVGQGVGRHSLHQKVLEVREPSWLPNPFPKKTNWRGPWIEGDLGMGRAGSTIQIIDCGSPLSVLGARRQPHLRAFSSAQHVSGEETSQISGALQGFGMPASEEFEHQKVQRWLENPILKLSEAKHVFSVLFLWL